MQLLAVDVVEAKLNVRNMLAYFNHIVLKLAVSNPQNQNVNPQDIENSKSHLAKVSPDLPKLMAFLEKGDQHVLLMHIQKHLEEGQFKLPTDTENQIVQDFCSEDLLASIKIMEEQEDNYHKQMVQQQQMINVQQVQQQNKRVTRRSHLQSSDFAGGRASSGQ